MEFFYVSRGAKLSGPSRRIFIPPPHPCVSREPITVGRANSWPAKITKGFYVSVIGQAGGRAARWPGKPDYRIISPKSSLPPSLSLSLPPSLSLSLSLSLPTSLLAMAPGPWEHW